MDKTQALVKKFTSKKTTEFEVPPMEMGTPPIYPNRGVPHVGEPRGQDTTPAWLTPGEAVIPKEAVDAEPYTIARLINKGRAIQDAQQEYNPKYFMSDRVHYANQGLQVPPTIANIEEEVRVLRSIHGGDTEGVIQGLMANVGLSREEAIMAIRNKNDGGIVYANQGWVTDDLLDSLRMQESSNIHFDASKAGQKGYDAKGYRLSDAGAIGAYQWLPSSAANAGFGVTPFDVYDEDAQRNATRQYLEGIQRENPSWSPQEVLMAYNWGPGNVAAMKDKEIGKHQVPQEAINYADKVMGNIPQEGSGGFGFSIFPKAHAATLKSNKNINTIINQSDEAKAREIDNTLDNLMDDKAHDLVESGEARVVYNEEGIPEIWLPNSTDPFGELENSGIIFNANRFENKTIKPLAKVVPKNWKEYADQPEETMAGLHKYGTPFDVTEFSTGSFDNVDTSQDLTEDQKEQLSIDETDLLLQKHSMSKDAIDSHVPELDTIPLEIDDEEVTSDKEANTQANILRQHADRHPGAGPADENSAIKAAKTAPKDWTDGIAGAFKNAFSSLFNPDELARMAILYAGSRVLGYSHEGSLTWATKGYMNRIAGIETERKAGIKDRRAKAVAENMRDDYELASLDKWIQTGVMTDLIPKELPDTSMQIENLAPETQNGYVPGYGKVPLFKDSVSKRVYAKYTFKDKDGKMKMGYKLASQIPGFEIWADNQHGDKYLVGEFTDYAKSSADAAQGTIGKEEIRTRFKVHHSRLASEANSLYRDLIRKNMVPVNQSHQMREQIKLAMDDYIEAKKQYAISGKGINPKSLRGYVLRRTIVPLTGIPQGAVGETDNETLQKLDKKVRADMDKSKPEDEEYYNEWHSTWAAFTLMGDSDIGIKDKSNDFSFVNRAKKRGNISPFMLFVEDVSSAEINALNKAHSDGDQAKLTEIRNKIMKRISPNYKK